MGLQFHSKLQEGNTSTNPNMNRFISLFALVACALAEPEADPQYLILGDAHAKHAGLVKHPLSGAVVPDETNSVKAAKLQHLTAKANAYAYHAPYAYAPYAYAAPYTIAKRDAEAEPKADADPQF